MRIYQSIRLLDGNYGVFCGSLLANRTWLNCAMLMFACFGWWGSISAQHREEFHSRPAAGTAVVLVGEERALDRETWLGLETLVTSWFWLVVEDCRLRAPWKEVPLLNVFTTSICRSEETDRQTDRHTHTELGLRERGHTHTHTHWVGAQRESIGGQW